MVSKSVTTQVEYQQIISALKRLASPDRAKVSQRFFKTAPGEYGHGDVFLGLAVPQVRRLAKQFQSVPLDVVKKLLHSPIHEQRMLALYILIHQYQKGDAVIRKKIFEVYIRSTKYINNWDLVDSSAEYIVGDYLQAKNKRLLYQFARSKSIWERRIAILATFHYIKQGDCRETLKIAKMLLHDKHDLIHKAVGWMLREVGKRCSLAEEEQFLQRYWLEMPRTMVRYAIEHFPKNSQKRYSKKSITSRY